MTRRGATLSIFLLGDDPRLEQFVDEVARRNGGRVFAAVRPAARRLRRHRLPRPPQGTSPQRVSARVPPARG